MTFEEFKRSLGENANKYTDEQLHQLQWEIHSMADIILALRDQRLNNQQTAKSALPGNDNERSLVATE